MPKPYPTEFRRDVIAVARQGGSIALIAKDGANPAFPDTGRLLNRYATTNDTCSTLAEKRTVFRRLLRGGS